MEQDKAEKEQNKKDGIGRESDCDDSDMSETDSEDLQNE